MVWTRAGSGPAKDPLGRLQPTPDEPTHRGRLQIQGKDLRRESSWPWAQTTPPKKATALAEAVRQADGISGLVQVVAVVQRWCVHFAELLWLYFRAWQITIQRLGKLCQGCNGKQLIDQLQQLFQVVNSFELDRIKRQFFHRW